jgi:hypothetical protein
MSIKKIALHNFFVAGWQFFTIREYRPQHPTRSVAPKITFFDLFKKELQVALHY